MKRTGFNGYIHDFSVEYDAIDVDDIKDIHKYLMKKKWYTTYLKTLVAKQRIKCLDLLKSVFSLDHYFYQT